jgi:hypothetical protein
MKTNSKREVIARIAWPGLVPVAFFGLMLSSSGAGRAQSSSTSPAVPAATPAKTSPAAQIGQSSSPAERQSGGNHEGIQVHGYWVIEVKNPDGTVTARREFENSLVTTGNNAGGPMLVLLLSGLGASGGMGINLGTTGANPPCGTPGSANTVVCVPVTGVVLPPGTSVSGLNAPSTLTLSGTITPQQGNSCEPEAEICQPGTIDTVSTWVFLEGVTNGTIGGGTRYYLTSASDASSPPAFAQVPVSVGQTVNVTVTISFSSPS